MTVDPNVYALSISLQLESSDAFSSLEDFGQMAQDVEDRVSTAAQNTMNSIAGVAELLNENLAEAVGTTQNFSAAGAQLELTLSKAALAVKDAYDTQSNSLKDVEERLKFLEEIEDIQEKLEKSLESEHITGQEYLKLIDRWVAALEGKNLVHKEEGGLLDTESGQLRGLVADAGSLTDNFSNTNNVLKKTLVTLGTIWALIKLFDKETESFVTANYRVYGSQQQLVNQTRILSAEYGIFRKEALETYKALADVKTPRHEIDKLAKTVAQANRVTGLGIDVLAQYSFELRGAGFDADRTRKQIDMLSAAQRKFGLSTHDVQKAIRANNLSMEDQVIFFGKDAPEAFMKANLGLRAVAKELGVNEKAADDWMKTLQRTGIEAEIFWDGFAGISADATITEKFDAMQSASRAFADEIELTSRQMQGLDQVSSDQAVSIRDLTEEFGISREQLFLMARAEAELTDAQKESMLTMAGIEKAFKTQIDADKRWRESMHTLTAQLNSLKASITAVIGVIVQLAADALIPLLEGLVWIINKIGAFIDIVKSAIAWMEEWIPGFRQFMVVAKYVIGILIVLGAVILAAGIAVATFATIFSGAAGVLSGALNIIRIVGQAIISIAIAIGGAIRIILTSIGQGLAALGSAIAPIILPLMGLGLAVLLIGAGFYLMGLGMYYAAQQGWAAVGMLLAMTVAMVLMIATLAFIATIVAPVVPLIVALGFALLLVGGAAMLMGLGLYLASLGVQALAEYGLAAAKVLPALGTALFWFGIKSAAAIPGLMALGVAMALTAIPALILATAFYIMSAAMTVLVALAPHLVKFGVALRDMILILSESASLLIPIGLKLAAGAILIATASTLLLLAAPILIAAAILMLAGGVILVVAGATLGIGAGVLFGAAVLMFTAGVLIGIGGTLMLAGMTSMIAATILMFSSAITLFFASTALAVAVGYLVIIAATMMTTGALMLAGGIALYASMVVLHTAALWMQVIGELFGSAISRFVRTIGKVDQMSKAMYLLAISFGILHQAPIGALGDAANEALLAIPTINRVARELDHSATIFQHAADKFVQPVREIAGALQELGDAMSAIGGQGLAVQEDMDQLGAMLEKYTQLLEGTAIRIETAVIAKAVPAMAAAKEAGLDDVVRSEAITTVQVMDRTEGDATTTDENTVLAAEQVSLLRSLNDKLEGMQAGGAGELTAIVDLLEAYLPEMINKGGGLSTELNQWMK